MHKPTVRGEVDFVVAGIPITQWPGKSEFRIGRTFELPDATIPEANGAALPVGVEIHPQGPPFEIQVEFAQAAVVQSHLVQPLECGRLRRHDNPGPDPFQMRGVSSRHVLGRPVLRLTPPLQGEEFHVAFLVVASAPKASERPSNSATGAILNRSPEIHRKFFASHPPGRH